MDPGREPGQGAVVDGLLSEFKVTIEMPVVWGDMDAFRHVNNVVFFRYFESARIAYLERIGFDAELPGSSIGPILASTHCRFRRPLRYPDVVRVGARATELRPDRFLMEYRVASAALGAVAAEGGGTVVGFDYRNFSKADLPEQVRAAIVHLEGGALAGT